MNWIFQNEYCYVMNLLKAGYKVCVGLCVLGQLRYWGGGGGGGR